MKTNISNAECLDKLIELRACSEATAWVSGHGGNSSELWRDCERGDWMGWFLGKSSEYRKAKGFYLALADIVDIQCVPIYAKFNPKEKALKNVVKVLRAYAKGKATKKDLKDAADASYAADAADASYAAANAAAYAADAAAHAADAFYVAYVADVAAYAAARAKSLKQSADIFRKHFKI